MTTVQEAVRFTADDALDWLDEGCFEHALSMIARRKREANSSSKKGWNWAKGAASSNLAYAASRLSRRRLDLMSIVATSGISRYYGCNFWNTYEDQEAMRAPE